MATPPDHAAFKTPDLVPIRTALISVSDKAGVEAFARSLASHGVRLLSTGGTAKLLRDAGLSVTPVEEWTGAAEMMDGRVKTLHPKVHGAILAVRDLPHHARALGELAVAPIDLVCINLYPFERTVADPAVRIEEAIEQIDIGGPAMVRSAAKNHAYCTVVTHASQYGPILAEMAVTEGCTSAALRRQLAAAAFARTAAYDAAIEAYLTPRAQPPAPHQHASTPTAASGDPSATASVASVHFPERLVLKYERTQTLRYGENPHQAAAVYRENLGPAGTPHAGPSVVGARQIHGKELSYNNLHDAAAALELVIGLAAVANERFAAAVIKHANPCGAALAPSPAVAIDRAIAGDELAAFGGILACSGAIDLPAAQRLVRAGTFLEVILAPHFNDDAAAMLRAKSVNVRLLAVGDLLAAAQRGASPASATHAASAAPLTFKSIPGGLLVQEADRLPPSPQRWTHAAGPAPDAAKLNAAAAIEVVVRAMSSNAIAIGGIDPADASSVRLFGGGVGQVDRVTACGLAVTKAGPLARGAIAVSDAFFPFPDGPEKLIAAGVTTIVHPGGSKRDHETFELCNKHGVTCLVTGVRRFRH